MDLTERLALVERLRGRREEVAAEVTREFFARHPDWWDRFGERGFRHGVEDAGLHLDFLCGALAAGDEEELEAYGAWTARLLVRLGMEADDLGENLAQIGGRLEAGLEDEEERRTVARFVAAGVRGAERAAAEEETEGDEEDDEGDAALRDARQVLLQALLAGARRAAATIGREELERLGGDVVRLYEGLFRPVLVRIGKLWQEGVISVADEHAATAILQAVIASAYLELPLPEESRGRAVVAGAQGELHQIGAMMVADALEADGWDARFLGSDLPDGHVLKAIADHRADVFGLSVGVLPNVPAALRLVQAVRERFPELPIVLGGRGVGAGGEAVAAELGLEPPVRDLPAAVERFRRLAPGRS